MFIDINHIIDLTIQHEFQLPGNLQFNVPPEDNHLMIETLVGC